jgi:hypothetical protein
MIDREKAYKAFDELEFDDEKPVKTLAELTYREQISKAHKEAVDLAIMLRLTMEAMDKRT